MVTVSSEGVSVYKKEMEKIKKWDDLKRNYVLLNSCVLPVVVLLNEKKRKRKKEKLQIRPANNTVANIISKSLFV